ncbi:MAG TPA: DUF3147 family protein [Candidatus Thalassarchaeaceae archaeon]|nr:DUF3147 family protein [Candidatus Thalassarchaeaceae archaeon]
MVWQSLLARGIFSGTLVVLASEIGKRSALFGAMVVSIPLTSILSMWFIHQDTRDVAQVAEFADSVLWLVLPSCALFVIMPFLLRRGWEFASAIGVGIVATIILYGISIMLATQVGGIEA